MTSYHVRSCDTVYTITELSRESGYKPSTIRRYATVGLIPRANHRGIGATWPPLTLALLLKFRALHHPDNRLTRVDHAIEAGLVPKGA